jgi:hypothetical protein
VEERNLCARCGVAWDNPKRKRQDSLCADCRARPAKTIKYGIERCLPWQGSFTICDEPLLHGELFLPGSRDCLHSDCVNPNHIKTVVELIHDDKQER